MQVMYTPAAIFCLIAVVLCLLTGSILLTFSPHTTNRLANRLLGAAFLSFSITLFILFLIFTRLLLLLPHFYRVGNISWLLYIPLSYLYVRTAIKRLPLSPFDLLHLLPALIYLVDYSPFILSSAATKLPFIKADLDNLELVNSFRQGWLFPPYFHAPARTLLAAFYWILQVNLLRRIDKTTRQQNPIWFRWQLLYNLLQILLFGPTFISMIIGHFSVWASTIPPAAGALLSAITLYLYPQILYGLKEENEQSPGSSPTPSLAPSTPIRHRAQLDEAFVEQLNQSLEKLMIDHQPFLNSNYSLKELAIDLNIPLHQASAFINQTTGKHFNEYLNYQRIAWCLEFIKAGKAEHLNMNGIAQQCGFNNRNTFAIAFKKVTGKLPSEYITGSATNT
jgi:AraC-like DNA-binding protein